MHTMNWAAGALATCLMISAAGPSAAALASGDSAPGLIETIPPEVGELTIPASASASPIDVDYSGVSDAHSGLLYAELWYRTESTFWETSGLSESSGAGTFSFAPPGIPPANHGSYFFALVAVDTRGNSSPLPNGPFIGGASNTHFEPTSQVQCWWVLE